MAALTGELCETCDLAVSLTPALNFLFHAKLYVYNIAYLELRNGSAGYGTQAQASHLNTDPATNQNQQWQITASGSFWFIQNRQSGTVLELSNGGSTNGTKAQGWQKVPNDSQLWTMQRVSRTGMEIQAIVALYDNRFPLPPFKSYQDSDKSYIILPDVVRSNIWNNSGLSHISRTEVFDSDNYAITAKAAVAQWANGYLRIDNISILFGIVFGINRDEGGTGACNWYLPKDLTALEFFQPQTGQDQAGLWHDVISFGMF